MPKRIPTHRPPGAPTRKEQNARYDAKRYDDEVRRLYRTQRWRNTAALILLRDPYCVRCEAKGIVSVSTVANHKHKARDNIARFFDPEILEGVCKPCHDRDIQAEERKATHGTKQG